MTPGDGVTIGWSQFYWAAQCSEFCCRTGTQQTLDDTCRQAATLDLAVFHWRIMLLTFHRTVKLWISSQVYNHFYLGHFPPKGDKSDVAEIRSLWWSGTAPDAAISMTYSAITDRRQRTRTSSAGGLKLNPL